MAEPREIVVHFQSIPAMSVAELLETINALRKVVEQVAEKQPRIAHFCFECCAGLAAEFELRRRAAGPQINARLN